MINRNNYELFIIDFYDEKLSSTQKAELFVFLDQNPEIKEEFELYSPVTLDAGSEFFVGKEKLKKSSLNSRVVDQLIAYLESDLDKDGRRKIEELINSDQEVFVELEILKKTKVLPDYNIVFKNKSVLKRGGRIILFQSPTFGKVAVAASVLLLLFSYYFFNKPQQSEIVSNQPSVIDSASSSQKAPINKQEISSDKKIIHEETPIQNLASREKVNHNGSEHKGFDKKSIQNNFSPVDSASTAEKNKKFEKSSDTFSTEFEKQEFKNEIQKNNFEKMVFLKQDSLVKNNSDNIKITIQKNVIQNNVSYSIADVFTKQEMNELGFDSSVKDVGFVSMTFSKVVLKKVEALAAIKEIKLNKHYNQNVASVSYNINFGQTFSIEHIGSK